MGQFFQKSVGKKALPAVSQYVTSGVFNELLAKKYVTREHEAGEVELSPLTWEDENALRYVGGYICRRVREKIAKSSLSHKEDMLELTMDLCGDEEDVDQGTETWTNEIDRGGLWHISDDTYAVFIILEDVIRHHLRVKAIKKLDERTKKTVMDAILSNEDLLFQWALVSANADDSIGMDLLKEMSTLYLTVRGFAFATSCLELYKQRHKRQVQKSKALRRKVQESKTD